MLTIAEVSGLIAAGVIIVQYSLPAASVLLLVHFAGTENSAVTWSVLNRVISKTIWPHVFRADAVSTQHVSRSTNLLGWTSTISAALLVLASVLAPLGLSEEIIPGDAKAVEFTYVKDPSPWGRVTMPRPNFKFSRRCEVGRRINCPGQYQGVYMNETTPGTLTSVETDETSTINLTIPVNYTAMFMSATSGVGNTVSGLFDIQYRRWALDRWSVYDKGQPFVVGEFRHIESLITQDEILLKEGLIVDMRENPGIGFRNHTVPIGLEYGGIWSEDITWMEPVTRCADTNLSIELRTENPEDDSSNIESFFIVDRGAFIDLDNTALETRPWEDNQTLDLFGRAHKAARMHNVLVASSLNISLPLNPTTKTLPKIPMEKTLVRNPDSFDTILLGKMEGLGGPPPRVPGYSTGNGSLPADFVPLYSDGIRKRLALNHSATTQICRGYYSIRSEDSDRRANNITYPAVQCGFVLGAPVQTAEESISASVYTGVSTKQRNLYVCASGIRASVKTVDFRYNGTSSELSNLDVLQIKDKAYSDEESKPLWAVEHSDGLIMQFESLWGIVDSKYETMDGFYSLRAEGLWLPTNPHLTFNLGQHEGMDALAAVTGWIRGLGNLYKGFSLDDRDYSGKFEYGIYERFKKLSLNETGAAQIPSLIMTDGLAAGLVGTKTSISTKYVEWPATLAVDDVGHGIPRLKVRAYKRVIRYDTRYAIPSFVVLALLLAALLGAIAILISTRSILRIMQNVYNQTGPGRLATNLLRHGQGDPKQSSADWVKGDGALHLSFGQIKAPESDYFCKVVGNSYDAVPTNEYK